MRLITRLPVLVISGRRKATSNGRLKVGLNDISTHAPMKLLPSRNLLTGCRRIYRTIQSSAGLIHNDYKYDNLVLSPDDLGRVIAVLDWEMATIGDPLMDFGTSLGYWVETNDPEEWQRYGFGLTMSSWKFYTQ